MKGRFSSGSWRSLMNLAVLYAGRVSGIVVVLFFLPLYSRVLGPDQFGLVAVVLSLQALLLMMDLGVSVLVSRDIALNSHSGEELAQLIRTAEFALGIFYGVILVGAVLYAILFGVNGVAIDCIIASIVLFFSLVLQNLYYSASLARRTFIAASINQALGTAARAGCSALVLVYVAPSVRGFVFSQALCGIVHFLVTRYTFRKQALAPGGGTALNAGAELARACAFLKRGGPVALFALAGAAVTQLDKPFISVLVSAADVAPYYVATALCMLPISLLAGPVSQYFQPQLLRAFGHAEHAAGRRIIMQFAGVIMLVTVIPCCALWFARAQVLDLWMGSNASNATAAGYVGVLLPGFTIGALGFVPYSLLVAAQDFRFQAYLSVALTLATLTATYVFASMHSVLGICYVYAAYHTASTMLSWLRAVYIGPTRRLGLISLGIFFAACGALVSVAVACWIVLK